MITPGEAFPTPEQGSRPQPFFERHHPTLTKLFNVLGMPPAATKSLDAAVDATQPWVKGCHSRPEHVFTIDEDQSPVLHELYDVLGLKQSYQLPPGQYDQLLVLGATHIGNNRRLHFLRQAINNGGVRPQKIFLLGGQRKVYPEVEIPSIEKNMRDIARQNIDDRWIQGLRDGTERLWWETDLLRLAATAQLGQMTLEHVHPRPNSPDNMPQRYDFRWNDISLSIMHTLAVQRKNGEPRHTTEASMADWLLTTDPAPGSRIAFVAANPHIERVGKSARAILKDLGRYDIALIVGGSAAASKYKHEIYLGEIARNLYEDQRLIAGTTLAPNDQRRLVVLPEA